MADRPTVAAISQRFVDSLTSARAGTLADLRRLNGTRQAVKFSARTAPSSAGLLSAPLSGRPCVWYRAVTSPFTNPGSVDVHRPPTAPALVLSSAYPPARAGAGHGDEPTIEESTSEFRLTDGEAELTVTPGAALVDSAVVTTNELRSDGGRRMALLQEWILPVDQTVLVVGSAEPNAPDTLGPDGFGAPIVSTHDEAFLLSRARAGADVPDPRKILAAIVGVALVVAIVIALFVFGVL